MRGEIARPQPKPRPRALEQDEKRAARETLDKQESAKARTRAQGRCEVHRVANSPGHWYTSFAWRCTRKDTETHHLKGGIGRRNHSDSILAIWKLRVCAPCHRLITARLLVPVDLTADANGMVYRRAR